MKFIKVFYFIAVAITASLVTYAYEFVPEDPFFERFDKADAIVMGEITAVTESDRSITNLGNYPKEKFQIAILKISKVWKGNVRKGNVVDIYFLSPSKFEVSPPEIKKGLISYIYHKSKGEISIFYLRRIDGYYVAATKFGIYTRFPKEDKIENWPEKKALDAKFSGASEKEIYKLLFP